MNRKENHSNMLGDIVRMDAVSATQTIGSKYFDQDNFYPADGEQLFEDDYEAMDVPEDTDIDDLSPDSDYFDGDDEEYDDADGDYDDEDEDSIYANEAEYDADGDYEEYDDADGDYEDDEDYDNADGTYDDEEILIADNSEDYLDEDGDMSGDYNDLPGGAFDFFDGNDQLDDMSDILTDEFSYATGRRRKRRKSTVLSRTRNRLSSRAEEASKRRKERREGRTERRDERQAERKERRKTRQGFRDAKKQAKIDETLTRSKVAESLAAPDTSLQVLSQTLGASDATTKSIGTSNKKGSNTGLIIGVSIGILALAGITAYFVLKPRSK